MIARFFIDRPILANVLALLMLLLGAVSLINLPVAQYPQLTPPTIQVTTSYPGANALTVQQQVARTIEQQVNGVEGMIYMQSNSSNDGRYTLTVTFAVGTNTDQAQVAVQTRVAIATPKLPSARTTGCLIPAPTARIAPCGGLMTASKFSTPIIPRLEIARLPPWYSWGLSFFILARAAKSFISADRADNDLVSASRSTGVKRPPSTATATATSDGLSFKIRSPAHTALALGTVCSASAQALMMKSLREILMPRDSNPLFICSRKAISVSRRTSRRR
jgi:hypothetical protein